MRILYFLVVLVGIGIIIQSHIIDNDVKFLTGVVFLCSGAILQKLEDIKDK